MLKQPKHSYLDSRATPLKNYAGSWEIWNLGSELKVEF